jgi:rhomboid protease GluP
MKLRALIADFRDYPATMILGAVWVAVFLGMVLTQLANGQLHSPRDLVLSIRGGHQFGDLTLAELRHGEIWRMLTATFVHYGLLHIGLNLWMFYQLGAEVESWYGSSQFAAVYVLIGGGGNLLAGLIRIALHENPQIHSGGGSVVTLGLVALLAIVGWRSRTPFGDYVRSQMVWVLIFTAVFGLLVPFIDKWGHAGGALIGAAIGFAHRSLIQTTHRPIAQGMGALAVLLLVGSAVAQVHDNRVERSYRACLLDSVQHYRATVETKERLAELGEFYRLAAQRAALERTWYVSRTRFVPKVLQRGAPPTPAPRHFRMPPLIESSHETFRDALKAQLAWFDSVRDDLAMGTGPYAADYQRILILLARVFTRLPTENEIRQFHSHLASLIRYAQQNENAARARMETLARPG